MIIQDDRLYLVTVVRGPRAGLVRTFRGQRVAQNQADGFDQEYGAICAHVSRVYPRWK